MEMEEFLSAPWPRVLQLAEQGTRVSSLQDSLVGALSHFQALQQQRSKRRATDITTWIRCFTLYMAVLSKKKAELVPNMVAHLHTVLRLHQRASYQLAWLEYDMQFRMELAASTDRSSSSGDPWQYISCLPSERSTSDPFEVSELDQEPQYKGKRPPEQDGEKGGKPPAKKVKKGVCRLHNTASNGYPYGKDCIFLH